MFIVRYICNMLNISVMYLLKMVIGFLRILTFLGWHLGFFCVFGLGFAENVLSIMGQEGG